jgi:ABC-type tungstate transport system substrate-binding protein
MIQGLQPRSENFIEYLWVLEVGPVGAFHCLRSIVTVVLGKRVISRTLVVSCGRNAADFK